MFGAGTLCKKSLFSFWINVRTEKKIRCFSVDNKNVINKTY